MSQSGYGTLHSAKSAQINRLGKEGCSIDPNNPNLPDGIEEGDQIRLTRHDGTDFAVYTAFLRSEWRAHVGRLRLSLDGRLRMNYGPLSGEQVAVSSVVVADGLSKAEAKAHGELVEFVGNDEDSRTHARTLLILAPHGGTIEINTDKVAERIHKSSQFIQNSILWGCLGYKVGGGAYTRWHVTSASISPRSFPKLRHLLLYQGRFDRALSIHGHSGADILIGGAGTTATKISIKKHLLAADLSAAVRVLTPGMPLAGASPHNIVNRYTDDGIQIELPLNIRHLHWETVADAIAAGMAEGP
ncbi:MAG: phage replication-related protein YjqB (UPF0714/DUF867 family) [Planctomycetota bacterium]|jgi:phage replication-related protein YjqB (UPF0714/DUF867 family)